MEGDLVEKTMDQLGIGESLRPRRRPEQQGKEHGPPLGPRKEVGKVADGWGRGATELGRTSLGCTQVSSHCAAALGAAAGGRNGRRGSGGGGKGRPQAAAARGREAGSALTRAGSRWPQEASGGLWGWRRRARTTGVSQSPPLYALTSSSGSDSQVPGDVRLISLARHPDPG
uniref:Uncharacterized protein n=1 Tax=Ananas comosus var. bracteatus TaxID=296719 RepID=A0A6V7QMQ7_ANACO|nr:unnamed protein product [Ananas comosus var. bracteatus]